MAKSALSMLEKKAISAGRSAKKFLLGTAVAVGLAGCGSGSGSGGRTYSSSSPPDRYADNGGTESGGSRTEDFEITNSGFVGGYQPDAYFVVENYGGCDAAVRNAGFASEVTYVAQYNINTNEEYNVRWIMPSGRVETMSGELDGMMCLVAPMHTIDLEYGRNFIELEINGEVVDRQGFDYIGESSDGESSDGESFGMTDVSINSDPEVDYFATANFADGTTVDYWSLEEAVEGTNDLTEVKAIRMTNPDGKVYLLGLDEYSRPIRAETDEGTVLTQYTGNSREPDFYFHYTRDVLDSLKPIEGRSLRGIRHGKFMSDIDNPEYSFCTFVNRTAQALCPEVEADGDQSVLGYMLDLLDEDNAGAIAKKLACDALGREELPDGCPNGSPLTGVVRVSDVGPSVMDAPEYPPFSEAEIFGNPGQVPPEDSGDDYWPDDDCWTTCIFGMCFEDCDLSGFFGD